MVYFWIFSISALLLDQLSKWGILYLLQLSPDKNLIILPNFIEFRLGWNQGINFGLFSNGSPAQKWLLIAIGIIIPILLFALGRKASFPTLHWASVGLITGGALGNVVDRLYHGAVVDFLNVTCCGIYNPFVFNLADCFIFGGVFVILFSNFKQDAARE